MKSYDDSFNPPAPIIETTIFNPNNNSSTKVKMLIDTGADETILPSSVLKNLGPGVIEYKRKAQTFVGEIVELKAILVQVKQFGLDFEQKYYACIDDEMGLLGRDILSSIIIELDGINSSWSFRI